jgi:hypothetical protein
VIATRGQRLVRSMIPDASGVPGNDELDALKAAQATPRRDMEEHGVVVEFRGMGAEDDL